jgi:hypothetical protein
MPTHIRLAFAGTLSSLWLRIVLIDCSIQSLSSDSLLRPNRSGFSSQRLLHDFEVRTAKLALSADRTSPSSTWMHGPARFSCKNVGRALGRGTLWPATPHC